MTTKPAECDRNNCNALNSHTVKSKPMTSQSGNKKSILLFVTKYAYVIKIIASAILILWTLRGGQVLLAAEIDTGVVSGTLGNTLLPQSVQRVFKKIPKPLTNTQLSLQHYYVAATHLSIGEVDKAENNLSLALSYDVNNSQARDLLATLYSRTGRSELAIDILQSENIFTRQTYTSSLLLANLLAARGEVQAAITVMQRMSPTQKTNQQHQQIEYQQYYATLAALLYRDAQYDGAQQIYKNLLQRNPHNSVWWLGLGMTLEANARTKAALKAYEQAKQNGLGQGAVAQFVDQRISTLRQQQSSLAAAQAG